MIKPFHIKRAEYVEVQIPAGNTRQQIYFPDLPNLRTSKVFGIEIYSAETQLRTLTGATNQNFQEIVNANIVLYFEGGEFINVAGISLYRIGTAGGNVYTYESIPMLSGQVIVWAKSYVYLTDSANIANYAGKNFVFNIYYEKNNI